MEFCMNKNEVLQDYKNQEERLLLAKVMDKIDFSKSRNKIENTDFLNLFEQDLIDKFMKKIKFTNYYFFGGAPETERKILVIYPEKLTEEMAKKNHSKIISIIKIKLPINQEEFNHRNYLGALMKLGIEREKIGDLSNLDDKDVVILTSSDNERPFSNLDRILNGYDKYVKIKNTDTVFFLDSITDATEKAAVRICDSIARCGAEVVTLSKNNITYHASSEDLMLMLDLINPKYYFPVMGEYRFQVANANIASLIGIPKENILLKQNGDVVEFDNGVLKESNEHIEVNDIMIDGTASEDIGELVLKDREMLSDNGIVIVCATLDKKSKEILAGPAILTRGFVYVKDSGDMIKEIERISKEKIIENTNNNYVEFNKIKNSRKWKNQ